MAEFPFMPMYWDAYLGDTKHLTCLEHGAYLQILAVMWRSGGVLPDDEEFLISITGLRHSQWRRMRHRIMAFMRPVTGGRFTQSKLAYQLDVVRTKSNKASHNAKARWLKTKGLPDALAVRTLSERNAYQTHIESYLPVQSTTQAEKQEEGSAERTEPAAASATIIVSPALAARFTNRKTG